jgi:hypothetical protein
MLGCLGGIIVVNTKGHTPALVRGDVGEVWELMENIPNRRDLDPRLMIGIFSVERLEKVNLIPTILGA